MTNPKPTLPGIPEQIARYQLLSELGRGSMGHVYLALDPNIDRKVAIKIFVPLLKVGVAEQWELRQRFVFEARAAGQIKHPGIVTIYDADTDPDTGLSYLAMEWVNGPSLDDLIRESGPVGVERSTTIVEEVAVALDAAHRLGLVHRDIKPANILLEASGRAKVTDFGIAKLASMSITTTGWIPGSPFYMSPEQIRNENIDRRSDLYALGAVLYQCLTGRLPFEAESLAALTHMILEIDPRPVRSVNPAVSSDLAAVIDQAMAKSPDDRFDSGREFARALQLARAGEFRPAPRGAETAGRRRGTVEKPAGELGVGGTGTIGLAAPSGEEPPAVVAPPAAEEPAQAPASANDPPAEPPGRRAVVATGVGRLAIAMGIVLVLVALWSLSPVASEPTGESPVVERVLSLAPRFAADAPLAGPALVVPSQPPAAAESLASPEAGEPFEWPGPGAGPAAEARSPAPAAAPRKPASRRAPRASPVVEPAATAVEPAPREPASLPPPAPAVRATSKLELVYRNRLKNASLAVFIDGERAFSSGIATPPGFLNRTVGKNFWTSLPLTAGEHVVDVRVTGAEGKVDLVRQTTATFEDGQTHRLRVTVTPLKNLKLNWKESPVD